MFVFDVSGATTPTPASTPCLSGSYPQPQPFSFAQTPASSPLSRAPDPQREVVVGVLFEMATVSVGAGSCAWREGDVEEGEGTAEDEKR